MSYRTQSQRYGGQFSVNWQLPRGFSLQASGRLEKGNTGVGENFINSYSTNSVMVRLVKTFSWGKKTGVAGLETRRVGWGPKQVEGWVFNDANLNGAMDSGEEGVEGVKVRAGGWQRSGHRCSGVL